MTRKTAWLILLASIFQLQTSHAIDIPFGKNGIVTYDMETGTFTIRSHGKRWLEQGFSAATNAGKPLTSKQYSQRTHTVTPFSDGSGKGTKHVIVSRQQGLPDFWQVFHTYSDRDYIVLEVGIHDPVNKVFSNQLMPVEGMFPTDGISLVRSFFSPFDNDTFISYDSHSLAEIEELHSAEVGALYHGKDRSGLVMGSIEQGVWKTGIRTARNHGDSVTMQALVGYTAKDLNRDDMSHGALQGDSVHSAKVLLGWFTDWREGMDTYASHVKALQQRVVHPWLGPTPVAWNSWGVIQQGLHYERAVKVADFFADHVTPLESGQSIYIDLDSYWDNLLNGGLEGDYTQLKQFADHVKSKGLKPGIYWAPFVDWGYGGGPDRRVEGSSYTYGDIWTKVDNGYHDLDGARALDPTHPGTQQRLAWVISNMSACGFDMIKIDFLGHAAIESTGFADPSVKTGMQAYHAGMEYLVEQLGGQMLIYAAISPNIATAPFAHMRRIACDAFASIEDTRYTLNGLTYGWWQTHLYDYMDADHIVFKGASDNERMARFFSSLVTGSVVFGDDFSEDGEWHGITQRLFANRDLWSVIADGKSFTPVESDRYASRLFVKHGSEHTYIAVFNYEDRESTFVLSATQLGLEEGMRYHLTNLEDGSIDEFFSERPIRLASKHAKLYRATKIETD